MLVDSLPSAHPVLGTLGLASLIVATLCLYSGLKARQRNKLIASRGAAKYELLGWENRCLVGLVLFIAFIVLLAGLAGLLTHLDEHVKAEAVEEHYGVTIPDSGVLMATIDDGAARRLFSTEVSKGRMVDVYAFVDGADNKLKLAYAGGPEIPRASTIAQG